MFPAPFRVVLDANVLYPFFLRDTLLRAAQAGLYQLYWTDEVLDEACRNLVKNQQMSEEQAMKLCGAMTDAFPESMVVDYAKLIPSMQNDEKDRHVVAAAVRCGAQVIVTTNLRDFTPLPDGIEAQPPDEFLCDLFDLNPELLLEIVREQAAALKNPPIAFEELLRYLGKSVPHFAKCVVEATEA